MRKIHILIIFDTILGIFSLLASFLALTITLQTYKTYGWNTLYTATASQSASSFVPTIFLLLLIGVLFFMNAYLITKLSELKHEI